MRQRTGTGLVTSGIHTERLEKILEEGRFEPAAILKIWEDHGWPVVDSEGKARSRERLEGQQVSLVAIKRKAIVEVEGIDDEAPPGCPPRGTEGNT